MYGMAEEVISHCFCIQHQTATHIRHKKIEKPLNAYNFMI